MGPVAAMCQTRRVCEPVVAVVVAAGLGVRYGGSVPKPALTLGGRPLLAWSLEALRDGGCTHAVVVANAQVTELLGESLDVGIPLFQTLGGQSRQESVSKGLDVITREPALADAHVVVIHDAVRPLVPPAVVASVIDAVRSGESAVAPALPIVDSIRQVSGDQTRVVDRSQLRAIQTPQGFPLDVIVEAHRSATGLGLTDDLACAERLGHRVHLVSGSRRALKITEPTDLIVAEALLAKEQR